MLIGSYWHFGSVMLCHGKSCSQCFKGTRFLCISFNLQDPLTQWHCHIPEDLNPPQHNYEILISWIFREMLSTSSDCPENGGSKLIQNIHNYLPIYVVPYRKRSPSSLIMWQKPHTHIIWFCFWMWDLNYKNNDAERFSAHNVMVSVTTQWSLSHFQCSKMQPLFSVP